MAAALQLAASVVGSLVEGNDWDQFFAVTVSKLYSNMLLATLNARTMVVRATEDRENTVEIKSSQGIVFRAEFAAIGQAMDPGATGVAVEDHVTTNIPPAS